MFRIKYLSNIKIENNHMTILNFYIYVFITINGIVNSSLLKPE